MGSRRPQFETRTPPARRESPETSRRGSPEAARRPVRGRGHGGDRPGGSAGANADGGDSIRAYVEGLRGSKRTSESVRAVHRVEPREAVYGEFPASVPPAVRRALAARGIERPWVHQSDAWQALAEGRHVVVVTPTASGKSLCYSIPILSMLATEREGTALLLYPTKALAQDQCAELNVLLDSVGSELPSQVYDGDTPAELRRSVRESTRAVLSNPDMLHASILPNHERWRRFFTQLRWVVIDETHMYTGVFGSHMANVIRRLRRICTYYGSSPRFAMTTATIANPCELASNLIGDAVTEVRRNGAPSGEKYLVLFDPPILDAELQRRQSPSAAAHRLAVPLLEGGRACIIFARSRQGVEATTRRLREHFEERRQGSIARRIEGYRGGYLPNERRRIERGLRDGSVLGVVSTNALELGVDIGSLDACIIAGYPGTIASTWQQAGRAGRRQATSVAILVAGDDPVDQYLMHHPEYFLAASPEHGRIDPDNLRILCEHLKCAAFELPFPSNESFGRFGVDATQEVLAWLAEEAHLLTDAGGLWRWSAEGYPATTVSLRDIPDGNFVIIDQTRRKSEILGEIDFESAHKTVYPGAIYQHATRLFEVKRLDYEDRKAWVEEVRSEYFTQAIDQTRVFVLDVFGEDGDSTRRGHGEVRVMTRFPGYKKIRFRTQENIGYDEIRLPDLEKHTTAYWVTFDPDLLRGAGGDEESRAGALLGISHALHTVAVVHLMCAGHDLLTTVASRESGAWELGAASGEGANGPLPVPLSEGTLRDDPSVFLYDRYPGGVGFAEKLFGLHARLLDSALELILACGCERGCPSCVGPPESVTPRGREVAISILREALGALDPARAARASE